MTDPERDDAERYRRALWVEFGTGAWLRGNEWQPTKPGVYFCATRDGARTTLRHYRTDLTSKKDRVVDSHMGPNEPGWQGWIWSVSVPDSPVSAPPSWEQP